MYTSRWDYPWTMVPSFTYGFGQIIGVELMPKLAIAISYTKDLMQLDDGLNGFLLERVGATRKLVEEIVFAEQSVRNITKPLIAGLEEVTRILNLEERLREA